MKAPFLIGRLLFAGFFINSGISHLQKRKEMAEYARSKGGAGISGDAILHSPAAGRDQFAARRETEAGGSGGPGLSGRRFPRYA